MPFRQALFDRLLPGFFIQFGYPGEQMPEIRETLKLIRDTLPDDHWRIADAQSILGGCLSAQGHYEEAERLYLSGLEISRRVQGQEHPHTLSLMNTGRSPAFFLTASNTSTANRILFSRDPPNSSVR